MPAAPRPGLRGSSREPQRCAARYQGTTASVGFHEPPTDAQLPGHADPFGARALQSYLTKKGRRGVIPTTSKPWDPRRAGGHRDETRAYGHTDRAPSSRTAPAAWPQTARSIALCSALLEGRRADRARAVPPRGSSCAPSTPQRRDADLRTTSWRRPVGRDRRSRTLPTSQSKHAAMPAGVDLPSRTKAVEDSTALPAKRPSISRPTTWNVARHARARASLRLFFWTLTWCGSHGHGVRFAMRRPEAPVCAHAERASGGGSDVERSGRARVYARVRSSRRYAVTNGRRHASCSAMTTRFARGLVALSRVRWMSVVGGLHRGRGRRSRGADQPDVVIMDVAFPTGRGSNRSPSWRRCQDQGHMLTSYWTTGALRIIIAGASRTPQTDSRPSVAMPSSRCAGRCCWTRRDREGARAVAPGRGDDPARSLTEQDRKVSRDWRVHTTVISEALSSRENVKTSEPILDNLVCPGAPSRGYMAKHGAL